MELATCLADALSDAETRWPRGTVDPALGPEWRRRLGLGRVVGRAWSGGQWAVTVTSADHFVPMALPRMANIHPVDDLAQLRRHLAPWGQWLSTLGTDAANSDVPGVHRVCPLGWMQAPTIPRDHDGRRMLGGLQVLGRHSP